MELVLEKRGGKFNGEFRELLGALEDGTYVVSVRSLNPHKTLVEYRNEYFSFVDQFRDITGYTRYEIHEEFKNERNVETTGNFTVADWVEFITAFKWYCYQKADVAF